MTRYFLALAGDFPNPVGWAADQVKGLLGSASAQGLAVAVGGLTSWTLQATTWMVGAVFSFFSSATDPNVQADWFAAGHGPYAMTAAVGAVLLAGFLLIGITQGVLAGEVGGMLRRFALELPMAVVGMVGLVTLTQALIRVTDELSRGLLGQFSGDVHSFTSAVDSVSALTGGTTSSFVVFVVALVSVLAGVVLVAELVVRSALIYIVVALAPLVFAAQLWPAVRGAGRKLLELLVALIVSKLVVAVALAVAVAAAVGASTGGSVTAIPPPEVSAQHARSATGAVGILLAAAAAFGVAAFSPLLVTRLLPHTEAAVVASGIRGGPVRAGQQALSASYYTQAGRSRLTSIASGGPTVATAAEGGGAVAAAGSAVPAAAVVAGASQVAVGTARAGARAAMSMADDGSGDPLSDRRRGHRRAPARAGGDDDD